VSRDHLDLTEPHDPALDRLFQALTAGGTADEMAGRAAALETFRAGRSQPRRPRMPRLWLPRLRLPRLKPYRLRLAFSMGTAAAALVLTGGIAAAYAAALPAPVQHIAYRMLGRIGVPDTHRPAPSASVPAPATSVPARGAPAPSAPGSSAPSSSAAATAGCPCPAVSRTGAGAVPGLTLVAARAQVPAGGTDVLSGRLASGGRPEAGVHVRLFERVAGRPGWRATGGAVTDASGTVTLTVAHLTRNAWFRLAARGGALSPPVLITVIPPVTLDWTAGPRAGLDVLTARAPSAAAGDVIVLQERTGGVWHDVNRRVLGQDHQASFSVLVPTSGRVAYRVVLPRTAAHGRSVSAPVRITARTTRTKPKP
jgi:hypothetical protein